MNIIFHYLFIKLKAHKTTPSTKIAKGVGLKWKMKEVNNCTEQHDVYVIYKRKTKTIVMSSFEHLKT